MGPPVTPAGRRPGVSAVTVSGDSWRVSLAVVLTVLNLSAVAAGPVILNLGYLQGPVAVARNIRHLPCVSRRTNQEGMCMFAIDCLKANGTHLGTCIDRFYFGSCCQIPDKNILPQIVGNNIEDNSIENANFVHQTDDKYVSHNINKITDTNKNKYGTKKPVSSTQAPAETMEPRTDLPPQKDDTKAEDDQTTLDNDISDEDSKVTASFSSTEIPKIDTTKAVTEIPMKLSTFQTVSGGNNLPDKPDSHKTSETTTSKVTTTTSESSSIPPRPYRPTYKPRPGYRPVNFTRPQYSTKPRPTKPVTVSSTRKPPYRLPTKRPSSKKPLPVPPRLNITILPQSTSSRPIFTKPSSTPITFINTLKDETKPSTTSTTTTTTTPTTTTTTTTTTPAPTTTTTPEPTTTQATTIVTAAPTTVTTEPAPVETTTDKTTDSDVTEAFSPTTETTTANDDTTTEGGTTVDSETDSYKEVTEASEVTTEEPTTTEATKPEETPKPEEAPKPEESPKPEEAPVTSPKPSTEYPPFVTWSNPVESASKAPELGPTNDEWEPVTPPEGWVLISTMSPKPDTTHNATTPSISSSTTTPIDIPNTTSKTESPTTFTLDFLTESPQTTKTTEKSEVSEATTLPSSPSSPSVSTQGPILEFTVNVTLSPTVPTSTASMETTTKAANETTANMTDSATTLEATTEPATTVKPTTAAYDMSDYKSVCGRRLWPAGRIVGGAKSGFGQWPWQISLRQYRTSNYLHKCGAALLNENWAITAAHCVDRVPPSDLLVRLGEYDLASEEEPYGFAERRVQIIASHPHFDPATFEYDLALLRFYEPVTFQPNILPVCVPDDDDDFVGRTAYVTGWGRLYDEGPLPSVLQEVSVPVINNSACESMYLAAGYNEHIPNIFICAGWKKGGSDSCEGDSGGPMVIERTRDQRFVLSGVISWGIGCAEPNQPGVYTRISEFRDWINQILQF